MSVDFGGLVFVAVGGFEMDVRKMEMTPEMREFLEDTSSLDASDQFWAFRQKFDLEDTDAQRMYNQWLGT